MDELLTSFRFEVNLKRSPGVPGDATTARLGTGAFAECSGLELEADVREYLEGGRNDGVIRRVGRVKLVPLVLKRGMIVPTPPAREQDVTAPDPGYADHSLWDWLQGVVGGQRPVLRYSGDVFVRDAADTRVTAHWTFERGLPVKVTGPSLNARNGEIALEELHIAHEGLRLEPA